MRWSSHCVSFDIVFSFLQQSLFTDQHPHAERDPRNLTAMNRAVGKPFPIRIDFLQHQYVAVVAFSDATKIAFFIGEPDEVVLSERELLSLNGLEQNYGVVRVL